MLGDLRNATLGQYQIVERIGTGGMGVVYQAFQPSLERFVAIKVLNPGYAQEASVLDRFRREARAIARLEHRNILPIYDFGEHDGLLFIVMRFVTGGSLRDRLQEGMPVEQTNIGSTIESGEVTPSCGGSGASVWFRFTPASSGQLVASAAGSSFDTTLALYTGSTVSTLVEMACNDDAGASDRTSRIVANVTAGTTYYLRLAGFAGATGTYTLQVS